MGLSVTPSEFLKTLWGESQGVAELTAITPDGIVKSFPWAYTGTSPTVLDPFLASAQNHNKTANVYMGVCLRGEKWPRPTGRVGVDGKQIFEKRGTENNAFSSWVVWVEFDFIMADGKGHKGRVVSPEMARKWLAEFALKPSIIIKSGGGIQVYWLLKEAAEGDDLWRVKAINKALVELFTIEIDGRKYGADMQSVDLARILRIPGSSNIKYTPPRPCEISWWRPEIRYTLDDFDILNVTVEKPLLHQVGLPSLTVQGPLAPTPTAGQMPSTNGILPGAVRPTPAIVLPAEELEFIRENVQALWLPGQKHYMALRVAGMFAHANVALESAVAIIKAVSDATNSDTEKRVKDVVDTYNSFVGGKEVAGRTSLEQLINSDFPQDSKEKALSRVKAIAKKLPKAPRPPANGGGGGPGNPEEPEPEFHIKPPIYKFDSRPARYTLTFVFTDGEEFTATVETRVLTRFRDFQDALFEQADIMLPEVSQRMWIHLLRNAGKPEMIPTPPEAKPEGAIETAMESFVSDARETEDYGVLSVYAGYDEAETYFRFEAFKSFLKERDLRIEDRVVFQTLHKIGFETKAKRLRGKIYKLWVKEQASGDGPTNGNGNGHSPAPEILPPPPSPLKAVIETPGDIDLFPIEQTDGSSIVVKEVETPSILDVAANAEQSTEDF